MTQTIFSMNLIHAVNPGLLERDPSRVAGQLDHLNQLAQSALSEMHVLIAELRPNRWRKVGWRLPFASTLPAVRCLRIFQYPLEVEGDQSLKPAEEQGLFRIVQEAINNIVKHSSASQATIRLHQAEPFWIEVEDNGQGFDLKTAQTGSRPGRPSGTIQHARAGSRNRVGSVRDHFTRHRHTHSDKKISRREIGMSEQSEKITVLIVDDHQVVRQGLHTFLDLNDDVRVVGEAVDGQMAVEIAQKLDPDVILMDLVMPRLDGIGAIRQIKSLGLRSKVIALTSFTEDDKVFPAIQAGASSYLLKDVSPDDLVEAIRAAHRGEARLHPDIARKLMEQVAHQAGHARESPVENLTDRERGVIRLVAQGRSNAEIAQELVISDKTVKTHISNILGKLDLQDRTQLAIYAIKNGLI